MYASQPQFRCKREQRIALEEIGVLHVLPV
jgi:hypothetical protein